MEFITIYTTVDSSEISIIENLFEENGIHYITPDKFTDRALGMAGLGMAGMRVQVPESQKEQANSILQAHQFIQ